MFNSCCSRLAHVLLLMAMSLLALIGIASAVPLHDTRHEREQINGNDQPTYVRDDATKDDFWSLIETLQRIHGHVQERRMKEVAEERAEEVYHEAIAVTDSGSAKNDESGPGQDGRNLSTDEGEFRRYDLPIDSQRGFAIASSATNLRQIVPKESDFYLLEIENLRLAARDVVVDKLRALIEKALSESAQSVK